MTISEESQHLLSSIALKLNATLDLESLLTQSADAAGLLAKSDCAMVLLPNESGKYLLPRAFYSRHEDSTMPTVQFDIDSSIAGNVLREGEVYQTTNAQNFFPDNSVRSLMFIPMNSRMQVIGVLAVYNIVELRPFSKVTIDLLEQLAAYAAVAIENAWIYSESQARSFELALIVDAAEAVNSTLSQHRVLSLIGKSMLKALNCNYCAIAIRDYEQGQLQTRSLQRSATWNKDFGQLIPVNARLEKKLQKHFVVSSDNTLLLLAEDQILNNIDHALVIPIEDIGVLVLRFMGTLPDVNNPSFIDSMKAKGLELHTRLQAGEDNRALHIAHQILRHTEAIGCGWYRRTPEGLRLTLDESNVIWGGKAPYRNLENYPTLDYLLRVSQNQCYVASDPTLPEDMKRLVAELQVQVLLVIPFVIQEGDTGVMLIADTNRTYSFDPREINLGHALALQAANAIKNAQLFEDLQNSLEVLRRTQAKLVQTARLSAIGELAAAVAHQINNPLTTILGDTELLISELDSNDSKLDSLRAVYRAGQRAHEVVRRLLSMSRQKSSAEEPQVMNLNATIHNTLTLVEGTLYRGRVQLKIDLAEGLPDVYGLPGQLEDVWLNLILNARDAVREVKKPIIAITSRYSPQTHGVEVSVADNGVGLGGVDVDLLFDAFYTTKPPGEGTGLGLYICASVVERCGGTIKTGTSSYNGALFTVWLPCR